MTTPYKIHNGNSLEVLKTLDENSIDSIVCDPPYELGFMNKKWDSSGIAYNVELWKECLRVLKPGGHLLAFSDSRTYHRMAVAIEDAGFEVRDQIMWVYGCLSEDTYIVTPNGVNSYKEIKIGDLVLCYDKGSREYSYLPIEDIYEYDIKDTAYRITSDFTDQIVSRNHRCLVERNGIEVFVFAEECSEKEVVPFIQMEYSSITDIQHSTTLATITPFEYEGKVLCVKVPTGSFVAVRNGKAFPTGNSGFPKSHDISKAIDKRGGNTHLSKEIGDAIKKARLNRGLSIKECDDKFCGGTTNWSWFEGRPNGQRIPSTETLTDISKEWPEISNILELVKESKRKIIGNQTKARIKSSNSAIPSLGEEVEYKTWDITSSTTEEAEKWQGWGTALKPAHEPICLARKPFDTTVAENVILHGTGAINIDGCRIGTNTKTNSNGKRSMYGGNSLLESKTHNPETKKYDYGRFPANFIHDGSDEVVSLFPDSKGMSGGGIRKKESDIMPSIQVKGESDNEHLHRNDEGSAARFFYCAKASKKDRDEGCEGKELKARQTMGNGIGRQPNQDLANNHNHHPTVKPTDLMRYLCRLVTPPNGLILDPFMGSGSTGKAAMYEGFRFIGIDLDSEYCQIAEARIEFALNEKDKTSKPKEKKPKPKEQKPKDTNSSSLW